MTFAQLIHSSNRTRSRLLGQFTTLLEPMDDRRLGKLAGQSEMVTRRFFGRTMRLFAPLYLSNECINNCRYCGFSRDNPILRVTLSPEEVGREAKHLIQNGFRNILLVSGEHPKFVPNRYLHRVVEQLVPIVPGLSLEVAPLEADDYRPLVALGAEGLIVYQETYDREVYAELHTGGPKRNFDWRLECPERAYDAGFRRIGIGALFGLREWRQEAVALAEHLEYLLRKCWRAQLSVSFPRLRPASGGFRPPAAFSDRELLQLICAFRVTFPQVGIVLSTRESAEFRNLLMPLGVTMMSAGSRTEPGGYTGQGRQSLHLTVKGRIAKANCQGSRAEEQFEIQDDRSPSEVAEAIRSRGLEPVWKDWDAAILAV
jgi:2-iminoacetate synthase